MVWVRLPAEVIDDYVRRVHDRTLDGHRFEGRLCNAVAPWGGELIEAPVRLGGQRIGANGRITPSEVLGSEHPFLARILREQWPAADVLGRRDPARSTS
ncbi:hypothetical protein ACFVFS_06225 [Kitasatospora sp. NPDC057692]|uniref:hypothetical protein n=1 Tax=Kitasatospora sp. NPDC057692 TaxID=3346215 RepID=UPI00369FCCD1